MTTPQETLELLDGLAGQSLGAARGSATCHECGGNHEPSGARSDCIRHWKQRALAAENDLRVMPSELRAWLDQKIITSENICEIRRQCFMPWGGGWNALVRAETATREKSPSAKVSNPKERE